MPLQATGVHERIMELLTKVGTPKVFSKVEPKKVADRVKLGEPSILCVLTADVQEAFYRDIEKPRLDSSEPLRRAIAKGVGDGMFGYGSGAIPQVGADGKALVSRDKVRIGRPTSEDEIDLDSGWLVWPSAIPQSATGPQIEGTQTAVTPTTGPSGAPAGTSGGIVPPQECGGRVGVVHSFATEFKASRDQIYLAFQAIGNLADKSDNGKVKIIVQGSSKEGYDLSWLRNAVEEPLDEADVEKEE